MVDYSKAVKKLKKSLSLSDKELGKMLGVSGNAVWMWTSGRTTPRGAKKTAVDKELVKNNIVTQGELNNNSTDSKEKPKRELGRRGRKPGRRPGRPASQSIETVSADRNLLKTYYTQLAAEKKIKSFRMEIQGINKKHMKDLSPELWAEIMTMVEDF